MKRKYVTTAGSNRTPHNSINAKNRHSRDANNRKDISNGRNKGISTTAAPCNSRNANISLNAKNSMGTVNAIFRMPLQHAAAQLAATVKG